MQYLKADTITEVTIGPAVAVGDGYTPVTSLTVASADEAEIIKHGATATTAITGTLAAITGADGYYALDLSATDTNTEGRFTLLIQDVSLIRPIKMEFQVIPAGTYDLMFGAGTITLPGQEAPSLTPTLSDVLGWLFKTLRNKKTQSSSTYSLYADDESTVDATAPVSDDGATATVGEMVSGP